MSEQVEDDRAFLTLRANGTVPKETYLLEYKIRGRICMLERDSNGYFQIYCDDDQMLPNDVLLDVSRRIPTRIPRCIEKMKFVSRVRRAENAVMWNKYKHLLSYFGRQYCGSTYHIEIGLFFRYLPVMCNYCEAIMIDESYPLIQYLGRQCTEECGKEDQSIFELLLQICGLDNQYDEPEDEIYEYGSYLESNCKWFAKKLMEVGPVCVENAGMIIDVGFEACVLFQRVMRVIRCRYTIESNLYNQLSAVERRLLNVRFDPYWKNLVRNINQALQTNPEQADPEVVSMDGTVPLLEAVGCVEDKSAGDFIVLDQGSSLKDCSANKGEVLQASDVLQQVLSGDPLPATFSSEACSGLMAECARLYPGVHFNSGAVREFFRSMMPAQVKPIPGSDKV